jgi:hypothetical protein
MKRTLIALFVAGSLAALPAMAGRSSTKVNTNTNPAGSHTMVMTKSGQGANRVTSRTMTNTEGNKVLTSSKTMTNTKGNKVLTSSKTMTHSKGKRSLKRNAQIAKVHKIRKGRR